MIYIGIDPGVDGAIAIFDPVVTDTLQISDMPTYEVTKNRKTRREVNVQEVVNILTPQALSPKRKLIIELSGARPKDGSIQAHRTGVNWGVLYGVIVALKIQHAIVSPQMWKKAMKATSDKDLSRRLACERFPGFTNQFSRKKDHGRAEAALIAAYAYALDRGAIAPALE